MKPSQKFKPVVIATINGIDILASAGGDEMVPVRPICDLFGIASNKQIEKLKVNPLYNNELAIEYAIGADGKRHRMTCIPYGHAIAWIIGINSKKIRKEFQQGLVEKQKVCINSMKRHFKRK